MVTDAAKTAPLALREIDARSLGLTPAGAMSFCQLDPPLSVTWISWLEVTRHPSGPLNPAPARLVAVVEGLLVERLLLPGAWRATFLFDDAHDAITREDAKMLVTLQNFKYVAFTRPSFQRRFFY